MFCSGAFIALCFGALADAQLSLGSANNYAVFAASTITNTGLTVIGARIGLSPGTSITGFPPGVNLGQDIGNAAAIQAKTDIQALSTSLAALPVTTSLTGQDLGGQTLTPGVYNFASSGGLTGILTLDAQGDPNAVFVFQFGSTLTTATASSVVLLNGAQACNVYWQVGSSATLGTATVFAGVVVAQASITVTTGVSLLGGGFYALTAAVTLDTNIIDALGACGLAAPAPVTTTPIVSIVNAPITLAPVTVTLPPGTSLITLPASTLTITLPSLQTSILTLDPVTVIGTSLVTLPASTITVPATITVPTTVQTTVPTTITAPASTVTTTSTSTLTVSASTTTITLTQIATVTQTAATTVSTTVTSTATQVAIITSTVTARPTTCSRKRDAELEVRAARKPVTKTQTVTTKCAGHTQMVKHAFTQTIKATHTKTATVWHTHKTTSTHTSTKQPRCTVKAKRDLGRMFE